MTSLKGKRVWITGGGTGIGAGAARTLAAAGAEVVLSGRREAPLRAVVDEIRQAGGVASALSLDVSDREAVAQAGKQAGEIDILFANAGFNVPARAMRDLDTADWDRVVGVNLNGALYPVQAVLPGMRGRRDGLIILTASWAGRYATTLTGAAYNSTKRAVLALGESINSEEGANGVRTTVLMPGEVATDILKTRPHPPPAEEMARMLQVEDLARTVRFLAELPPRVCVNEILISPTWNRFYLGFDEI